MARKCPPGVFCISNMSLFMVTLMVGVLIYTSINMNKRRDESSRDVVVIERESSNSPSNPFYISPDTIFSSSKGDTYLNPYAPPLRENPFFRGSGGDVRGGVPINVPTSHYDMNYRQVGILTRTHGKETILALFGRPLHANRNKWQYYTMTDRNQTIKLPVSKKGKSCTGSYGCDEIFSGDSIYVDGYNDAFKATIYDTSEPRYIPYL